MRGPLFVWDCLRTIHSSLGLKREAFGLIISALLAGFYEPAKASLLAHGARGLPNIEGVWLAALFAGCYLLWHLLRHAVALEYKARPKLSLTILDPGQRYDTYVALGNRLLRLYHLEVANLSNFRTATRVAVSLKSYQLAGDKKVVDIRSKLKVANSDAEEIDLKPLASVVFELCGVDADGADTRGLAETRDGQTFSILPAGSGTIRIVAEADDAPTIEKHYTVYINTVGAMTIKPQPAAS
jgi:hypothetical protein